MSNIKEFECPLLIKVFPDGLEQGLGGSIIGVIEIHLNDMVFPGPNWHDFVVTILGWWLLSAYDLAAHRSEMVYYRFMDGPFEFSMGYITEQRWRIRLIRNASESEEVARGIIDSKAALKGLLVSADKIIVACKNKGWISNDIRELENQYTSLKSLVGVLR